MNDVAQSAARDPATLSGLDVDDALWYKDAVIYQLNVKSFLDSNDDGIGDFPGLTSKLGYIRDLGVNTIWLMPFYPSPLKDDGYDIADYKNIHPQYGTLDDFRTMLREAHRLGLKVVTELVINHTSDQHPWFQAARHAPPGSPERDFYVWSDTDQKYLGTRIIFLDTESSNWTFDPVAKQYYWHRFFSHQPDLNFDNPRVMDAVLDIMRFWLDMGVDGFRLDAIPYLVEREGTNNENLRETHEVIKRLRAAIDANYKNRFLLAEANQWPEDVREYFGDGDECHMAYHFPLMPRIYMSIAQEDRYPITEIMQQTPDIPDSCQWAIFLRNHDELTLEMVTSKERDYMYNDLRRGRAGAHQPRDPPPPRAAHGERPRPHQADGQPALVHARLAHPLLRRRDRHGRQRVHRRSQRRTHAHAMESRPQRRLLARRPAAALPAPHHGSGLRLCVGQRRGAIARSELAPELDQAHARGAQDQPGLRARHTPLPQARQSQDPRVPARVRRGQHPVRRESVALRPAGRAQSVRVQGPRARGDARAHDLSADRRPALSADAVGIRLLLVQTDAPTPRHRHGTSRSCPSTNVRCWCCSTAGAACSATASCPGASPWRRRRARSSRPTLCRGSSRRSAGTRPRARPSSVPASSIMCVWQEGKVSWVVALLDVVAGAETASYFMPLALAWEDKDEDSAAQSLHGRHRQDPPAGQRRRHG